MHLEGGQGAASEQTALEHDPLRLHTVSRPLSAALDAGKPCENREFHYVRTCISHANCFQVVRREASHDAHAQFRWQCTFMPVCQAPPPATAAQPQPVPPPGQRVKRQEVLAYDAAALCCGGGGVEVNFEELRAAHRCFIDIVFQQRISGVEDPMSVRPTCWWLMEPGEKLDVSGCTLLNL